MLNPVGGASGDKYPAVYRTPAREMDEPSQMVPKAGFEPAHPKALPPQDSVSTNSTTSALYPCKHCGAVLRITAMPVSGQLRNIGRHAV